MFDKLTVGTPITNMTGTVQCGYPLILGTEQLGPGCLPGLCATASNATPRLLSLQTIIPALHTPPQTTPVVVTLSLIISWLDMCGSNPVFRVAGGYLLVNGKPTVSPITLLDFPLRSLQLGSTCHRGLFRFPPVRRGIQWKHRVLPPQTDSPRHDGFQPPIARPTSRITLLPPLAEHSWQSSSPQSSSEASSFFASQAVSLIVGDKGGVENCTDR